MVYNCVLPKLLQEFGKDLHMGVTIRCPQTLRRIYYIQNQFSANALCK